MLVLFQRSNSILGESDPIVPLGEKLEKARGTVCIRESLDQRVFVADLAALVRRVLLHPGIFSMSRQCWAHLAFLRSNLLRGRTLFAGNLRTSQSY
jgi:hypothetical protein